METCPNCETVFCTAENFTPPNMVTCPNCNITTLSFSGGFADVMAAVDTMLPREDSK